MKKIFTLILVLLILLPSKAYAEETLQVNLENYQIQANMLTVYFNTNLMQDLSLSQLTLTLSGKELDVNEIRTIALAQEGISYLFLVDVSGSMKGQKISSMKKILTAISELITDKDNAAIMLVGNNTKFLNFISDNEKMQEQIDSIEKSSEDTNLYAAIIEALDILNTNHLVKAKKCLVILSDGKDDYTRGYTREEVNSRIEASNIPIHTVAILSAGATRDEIEASKVLGSFARLSAGGIDTVFGLDNRTADDIAKRIVESLEHGYIIRTDLTGYEISSDQAYMELKISSEDMQTVTDGYMINTAEIKKQLSTLKISHETGNIKTDYTGVTEDSNGNARNSFDASEKDGQALYSDDSSGEEAESTAKTNNFTLIKEHKESDWDDKAWTDDTYELMWVDDDLPDSKEYAREWIWIAVVVLLVFVISGITFFLLKYFPKKKSAKNIPQNLDSDGNLEDTQAENVSDNISIQIPRLELRFTKVGLNEGQAYTALIDKELVIGRNPEKADLTFPGDEHLSSRHCKITYINDKVYIEDLNSTNRTYLNGIPINQVHVLEQDDIILIGSMELRINWRRLQPD